VKFQPCALGLALLLSCGGGEEGTPKKPEDSAALYGGGDDGTPPDTEPEDVDGDGVLSGTDCDDTDSTVFPGAPEVCDGRDNDCDDRVDDDDDDLDLTTATEWHPDSDGDGYTSEPVVVRCTQPEGTRTEASSQLDCDDDDDAVSPGASEVCADGRDDDCDGLVDCEDGDCFDGGVCEEICSGELDEDGDGRVDCDDDECWGQEDCPIDLVFQINGGKLWLHREAAARSQRRTHTFASGISSVYNATTGLHTRASVFSMTGHMLRRVQGHVLSSCGFTQLSWSRVSLSTYGVYHRGTRVHTPYGAYLTSSYRTHTTSSIQRSPSFFEPTPVADCPPSLVAAVSAISWGSNSYAAHVPFTPVWSSSAGCADGGARRGSACAMKGSLSSSVTPMVISPVFDDDDSSDGDDWETIRSTSRRLQLQAGDTFTVVP